jgi:hypothetical protein
LSKESDIRDSKDRLYWPSGMMQVRQEMSRKSPLRNPTHKLPQGEDLQKLIGYLCMLGTPKEAQAFIHYFYGVKLSLSFILKYKRDIHSD